MKCRIQWVDEKTGKPTPDENEAVGIVWEMKHKEEISGRILDMEESEHFPICEEHKRQMREPGMKWWVFEPLPEVEEKTDVLCGCGWGRLAVPESELPESCPVCGHRFGEVDEEGEED